MRDIRGALVLVTGAGSGIGRATAMRCAAEGARVLLVDVNAEAAEETKRGLPRAARCGVHRVDVADAAAMDALAVELSGSGHVPDIIVNNAGVGVAGPLLDTSLEHWRRLIDVNLWGVVNGCRAFAPLLVRRGRGGHIVNVASAAGFGPLRSLPAYGTTKAAVIMLSRCLRAELAPHGIGVSVICPGLVNTAIVASTSYVGGDDAKQSASRDAALRLYRWRNYPPERVAERIVTAIRRNQGVVPVTIEAHAFRWLTRFAPDLLWRLGDRAPI